MGSKPKATEHFVHTRVGSEDIGEIVRVMYNAFSHSPHAVELFMGCKSIDDLPKVVDRFMKSVETDPTDIWTKVVDAKTGAIVAASNWNLYLKHASVQPRPLDNPPSWLEGEQAAASKAMLDAMNGPRIQSNADPFLHLHICFTSREYRRRGLASKMLKWGCDLADLLSLPGWIEAILQGSLLYQQFGFYRISDIVVEGEKSGVCMRRDIVVGSHRGWISIE